MINCPLCGNSREKSVPCRYCGEFVFDTVCAMVGYGANVKEKEACEFILMDHYIVLRTPPSRTAGLVGGVVGEVISAAVRKRISGFYDPQEMSKIIYLTHRKSAEKIHTLRFYFKDGTDMVVYPNNGQPFNKKLSAMLLKGLSAYGIPMENGTGKGYENRGCEHPFLRKKMYDKYICASAAKFVIPESCQIMIPPKTAEEQDVSGETSPVSQNVVPENQPEMPAQQNVVPENQPEMPAPQNVVPENQPEPPISQYVAPKQPEPPVSQYVAPKQPEPPVSQYAAPKQPEPPVSQYVAPQQPEPPVSQYVAPKQPEPPVSQYAAPKQPEPPVSQYVAPQQPEPPVSQYVAPKQPEPPVSQYVAPQQPEPPVSQYAAPKQPEMAAGMPMTPKKADVMPQEIPGVSVKEPSASGVVPYIKTEMIVGKMKYLRQLDFENILFFDGWYVAYMPATGLYILSVMVKGDTVYDRYYQITRQDYEMAKNDPDLLKASFPDAFDWMKRYPCGLSFLGSSSLLDYHGTQGFAAAASSGTAAPGSFQGYLYENGVLYAHILCAGKHFAVVPYKYIKGNGDQWLDSFRSDKRVRTFGISQQIRFRGIQVQYFDGFEQWKRDFDS